MCAYQRIDGAPCCSNAKFERQILREEWGFKGFITSDYEGINECVNHGIGDIEEVTALA